MLRSSLLSLLCLALASFSFAAIPADLIEELPGYGKTPSKHYSGFLPVDDAKSVFLHYWFVESTSNPSTDPIAVWMNGGPGCSSLEGYLTELGPFMFTGERDSTGLPLLEDNPNAWTTVSSVLFIEQPAGVGFSYAVNGSTKTDDFVQSQNTYGFLLNFFKAFPEYSKNDFFITGESYAGIYVPTLANRIVDGNAAGQPRINLKGIAVGDGCIGNSVGTCGDGGDSVQILLDFYYGHGMVSPVAYKAVYDVCDWHNPSDKCYEAAGKVTGSVGDIDVYNIYDTCGTDNAYRPSALSASSSRLRAPSPALQGLDDPVVCVPTVLSNDYLSSSVVQKAIHVDQAKLTNWGECYNIDYTSNLVSLLPTYPKLIANMNVLIYSGDADACVPWNGSYNWTRNLGLEETVAWRPWRTEGDGRSWVGGFATQWGANFSFVTIKHAGHMVPAFEPEAALTFYSAFLKHQLPQ